MHRPLDLRRSWSVRRPWSPRRRAALSGAAVLAVTLAVSACAPASAPAAPTTEATPTPTASTPITATDHAAGSQAGPVDVSVAGADGVSVTMREIRLAPGATTGVHCHLGQLIGVVTEGELTHYAAMYASGVHVYRAGDSLVEGVGYRHEGRNEGSVDTVLWVTYVIPEGDPLAVTDLSRCDP